MRNCQEMGIEVLPPDVNYSGKKFTVEDGKIRFGLLGIKNVGEQVIDAIIEAREEKGKFSDIFKLIENVDIHRMNKKAMESMIKAGALASLSENRAAMLGIYESLIESAQSNAKRNIEGQLSLFQMAAETMDQSQNSNKLPDIKNFDKDVLMALEKEMLGVYITDHPLKEYEDRIRRVTSLTAQDLADVLENEENGTISDKVQDGMKARMAGIITSKKNLITKNNKMMAFVDMEDLYGTVEVVVFPNVFERCANLIGEDTIIGVSGTINFKEGEMPKLLADNIVDLKDEDSIGLLNQKSNKKNWNRTSVKKVNEEQPDGIVKIRIPESDKDKVPATLEKLKAVMLRHPGKCQSIVYLPEGGSFRTSRELWVEPDDKFKEMIVSIVGINNYKS